MFDVREKVIWDIKLSQIYTCIGELSAELKGTSSFLLTQ